MMCNSRTLAPVPDTLLSNSGWFPCSSSRCAPVQCQILFAFAYCSHYSGWPAFVVNVRMWRCAHQPTSSCLRAPNSAPSFAVSSRIALLGANFISGFEECFSGSLVRRLWERLEPWPTSWKSSSADVSDSSATGSVVD